MEINGDVKLKKNQNSTWISKKLMAIDYNVVEFTGKKILIEKRAQKGEIILKDDEATYRIHFSNYCIYLQSLLTFVLTILIGYTLLETNLIGYFGFRNIVLLAIIGSLGVYDGIRASVQNTIVNKVFGQEDFFPINRNFITIFAALLGSSYLVEYVFTLDPSLLVAFVGLVVVGFIVYFRYPKSKRKRRNPNK
ncbi:MAG: hypothetical protein GYA51_05200 [Candidatus Methanofastidiosa archaeon]|jgi:positive regulator of sigma E activity|nr:hypothetical protein [Candidatus Methanofastidiosa archaeon]